MYKSIDKKKYIVYNMIMSEHCWRRIYMEKIRISSLYPKESEQFFQTVGDSRSINLEVYFEELLDRNKEYVEDVTAKKKFDVILSSGKSNVIFLTGFSQTGKTTFLQRYFEIKQNTAIVRGKRLIVPIMGWGETECKTPYDKAVGAIQGICDVLEQKYKNIEENFSKEGTKEFFEFILTTRASLLPTLSYSEECTLSLIERNRKRIDLMQMKNQLGYYLIRLKYYLYKYCVDINEIVIILDNIQQIFVDVKEQQKYVELLLHIYECMEKNHENIGRKITNQMIISVRPRNYRILKECSIAVPYTYKMVWKDNKFNSAELFRNILEKYGEDVTFDSETLISDSTEFHDMLVELSQKFGRKYSDMIEKLCFYDITLIFSAYKKILLNRTWVREGKFRYKSELNREQGLVFDNITCIRALGCGNATIFRQSDKMLSVSPVDKLIPNLLYNNEKKDYGLLILYTMKYYLRKYSREMEWGEAYILFEDFIHDFSTVFGDKIEDFLAVTDYMYDTEILRRSVHDMEKAEGEPYNNQFGTKNKLYITSRGSKLWDMLKNDSVLLEMCREDMYYYPDPEDDSRKSSYDLMMEGKQSTIFLELLKLIKRLFNEEYGYYSDCCRKGKKDLYRKLFGKQPITYRLLEGVSKSIKYSGLYQVMKRKENLQEYMFSRWIEMGE